MWKKLLIFLNVMCISLCIMIGSIRTEEDHAGVQGDYSYD